MLNLLRRALALALVANMALIGGLAPGDARMLLDPSGTGKLQMPGLKHGGMSINRFGADRRRANDGYNTGATGVNTGHLSYVVDFEFDQVRVWVGTRYTSGTPGTWKALIGTSDNLLVDTVDNAFTPQAAGVVNNALSTGGGAGWYATTWDGGAASKTEGLASGANSASFMHSDWINVTALPDKAGSSQFKVLARVAQITAGANFTQAGGDLTSYHTGRGQPGYREFMAQKVGSNGVDTLTNKATSVADGSSGYEPMVWLEFRAKNKPIRSFAVTGDSREANAAMVVDQQSWTRRATLELSTAAKPITHVNLSGSGHSQTQFLALLGAALDNGATFTDVIMPGFSQNGFVNPADFLPRNRAMIDRLRGLGITVWLTTDYAINGYGSREADRQTCITEAKNLAAQGLVRLVDTDSVVSDYSATPSNPNIKSTMNSGDGIHANDIGQVAMRDLLKPLIAGSL